MEDGEESQKSPVSESGEKPEEGKLCIIKIKVPKGDQIETNTTGRMNDQPRVSCSVCDKGFASGKALAGHMRVHFQSNNDNNHQNAAAAKKNTKTDHQILLDCWAKRENNSVTAAASGPTTCSICGKNFPSMKSLFGHMRCHPDREWRGINPPPSLSSSVAVEAVKEKEKNSLSSSDDRSDSGSDSMEIPAVDLAESLPKWSATDRRGRKPRASSVVVLPPAEERNLRTAVEELIRLAHSDSLESGVTHHHHHNHNHRVVVESFEATNSNSTTNNEAEIEAKNWVLESRKRRLEDYSSANKKKKLKLDEGESSEQVKTSTEYENSTNCKNFTEDELEELMIKKKKMRKKMKLSDLESPQDCYDVSPSPPPLPPAIDQTQTQIERCRYRYVCSTCNKCFPSHQALGGHRSSHNKVRVINNTTAIDHESSSDQNELQIQFHGNPKTTQLEEPITTNHRCTICNKTFPTGQALGGHKRCHWTGPAVAPSTSAGEASQTGNKVLGFDLNEPPPAEDDEEGGAVSEHAAGYGHASSSYNSVAN